MLLSVGRAASDCVDAAAGLTVLISISALALCHQDRTWRHQAEARSHCLEAASFASLPWV